MRATSRVDGEIVEGGSRPCGRTGDGLALWGIVVDGSEVPGRFVIVDGEFRRVEGAPA
jgi:hypothetical protein